MGLKSPCERGGPNLAKFGRKRPETEEPAWTVLSEFGQRDLRLKSLPGQCCPNFAEKGLRLKSPPGQCCPNLVVRDPWVYGRKDSMRPKSF
jgi:hypothetical protein